MPGPLLSIFLVILVDIFGMTLFIPLQAIYAEHFSATPAVATLLVSLYALCQLVAGPILGHLSDRYGRKPILLLSQVGTLIGFVVMAKAHALWMLFVARAIDGATAGNISIAQAYIADNTTPERRTRAFALIGIAFGTGFVLGPVVTAQLVPYGLAAPIWAAAALSALSIVCTLVLLPSGEKPVRHEGADAGPGGQRPSLFAFSLYADLFSRPKLSNLLWQFLAYVFSFSIFTSGFALFAERRFVWHDHPFAPREIAFLFAYAGFLGLVLQGGLIGRLVKRFGEQRLAIAGFSALAVAYVGLAFVHDVRLLLVIITLSAFGNGVSRPTLTGLISRTAQPHEQGRVLGTTGSLNSVAAIFAGVLSGPLIASGHTTLWPLASALAALGGLWGALSLTRLSKEEAA